MSNRPIPPVHDIHGKLLKINRLHHKAAERRFKVCKLHRSQHRLLMYLSNCETTPTQRTIADRFEVSPAAVATSLKKLEADGFIERQANAKDGRENMISITEKGRQIVEFSKMTFDELDRRAYFGLSDEELCQLDVLLGKIVTNLEERKSEDEAMV